MRQWLKEYFTKEYWKWKKRRQYKYGGWGWKYSAWVTMNWYKWLISVFVLTLFFSVPVSANAFSVTQVQYTGGNENVSHDGSCSSGIFQIFRASDSAQMTDGVLGCTGSSPSTEIVGGADVLIGSFPYSGDYYVKSDSNTSQIFTLDSGNYTPSPTPSATPSATPAYQLVDIATSSALAQGMVNSASLFYTGFQIVCVTAGFLLGAMFFFLS